MKNALDSKKKSIWTHKERWGDEQMIDGCDDWHLPLAPTVKDFIALLVKTNTDCYGGGDVHNLKELFLENRWVCELWDWNGLRYIFYRQPGPVYGNDALAARGIHE